MDKGPIRPRLLFRLVTTSRDATTFRGLKVTCIPWSRKGSSPCVSCPLFDLSTSDAISAYTSTCPKSTLPDFKTQTVSVIFPSRSRHSQPSMFKLSHFSSLIPLFTLLTTSPLPTLAQNGVASPDGAPMDMTSGAGGTYPRANPLADGTLIGTYAGVTASNQKELRLVQSSDQGASWTQIGVATSRPADESDLDNPYPLQLPGGRVLLAFRNHDRDPATDAYTAFRIDVTFSDDGGRTWEYLSTPASMPGGEIGIWEPLLRVADDDSLQIYYSKELATDNQDQIMRVSGDGGATWSEEMTIAGADILSRDGMTGVATLGGGKLVAVFESLQNGAFKVDAIDS